MNKKQLSERDICTKYITPALTRAGWDIQTQVREEFALTQGRNLPGKFQQRRLQNVTALLHESKISNTIGIKVGISRLQGR
ncbi:MAG: hypothetical protein VKJ24_06270 [Synechococcales bacterium]|nr:hypothetical protein [Synechococcales bacterium]